MAEFPHLAIKLWELHARLGVSQNLDMGFRIAILPNGRRLGYATHVVLLHELCGRADYGNTSDTSSFRAWHP